MILDTISRAQRYAAISPAFAKAMEFLAAHRDGDLADGKYPICEDAYALVKHYDSKPVENCHYEAHRDYADVQYVAAGREQIGWAPKETLHEDCYKEEKDQFCLSGTGRLIPMEAGDFMILFPEDGHMPCVAQGACAPVTKMILKVRVEK